MNKTISFESTSPDLKGLQALKDEDEFTLWMNNSQKVKPPFPMLPAFTVCASILQFVGFEDEIQALMNLLSGNTSDYFKCHKYILRGFMDNWRPEIAMMIEFGN